MRRPDLPTDCEPVYSNNRKVSNPNFSILSTQLNSTQPPNPNSTTTSAMATISRPFPNHIDAAERLAKELADDGYANRSDVIVLGLARGGAPMAWHIAESLQVDCDVLVVRTRTLLSFLP